MESGSIREELGYLAPLGAPSLLGTRGQVFGLKSLDKGSSSEPRALRSDVREELVCDIRMSSCSRWGAGLGNPEFLPLFLASNPSV